MFTSTVHFIWGFLGWIDQSVEMKICNFDGITTLGEKYGNRLVLCFSVPKYADPVPDGSA